MFVYFFLNFTHILIPDDMRCTHIKITLYAFCFIYPSINTFHYLNKFSNDLRFLRITKKNPSNNFFLSKFYFFRTSIPDSWNETNFWRIVWSLINFFFFLFLPFASWCSFNSSPLFEQSESESRTHLYVLYFHIFSRSQSERTCQNIFLWFQFFFIFSSPFPLFWSMSFKVCFSFLLLSHSLHRCSQLWHKHSHFCPFTLFFKMSHFSFFVITRSQFLAVLSHSWW